MPKSVVVPVTDQGQHRRQKRMARIHERRIGGMAFDADIGAVKRDPGVRVDHRVATPSDPVLVLDRSGNGAYLVTVLLPCAQRAAQIGERGGEKGLDVVRLKPPGFRAVHLVPDLLDLAARHRGRHELFRGEDSGEAVTDVLIDDLQQMGTDLRRVPVANRFDHQVT